MILPFGEMKELFKCSTWNKDEDTMFHVEHLLTEKKYELFEEYAKILLEWNGKINLTAIVDPSGITEKHFLDSVLPLEVLKIPLGGSIIDVGTGAGFPGIPMKILREDVKLTLLDSLNKRILFLKEVSEQLGLDANCVHARAEDGARNVSLRESFDMATARAVAGLPVLCEYCLPFVKVGGVFVALKGPNEDTSTMNAAVKLLGGEVERIERYQLPCGDERVLVIVKKISQTPTKFPRNSAQIAKKSL